MFGGAQDEKQEQRKMSIMGSDWWRCRMAHLPSDTCRAGGWARGWGSDRTDVGVGLKAQATGRVEKAHGLENSSGRASPPAAGMATVEARIVSRMPST